MRVPASLRHVVKRAEVRHSLGTGNARHAAALAAWLSAYYHYGFYALGDERMGLSPSDLARLKRQLASGELGQFGVKFHPDGRLQSIESDPNNPEDGKLAIEALKAVMGSGGVTPSHTPAELTSSPMLSAAIKEFLEQAFMILPNSQKPKKGWDTEKAKIERPNHLALMLKLLGDKTLRAIDRNAVEAAWSKLQSLPPNAEKSPKWRDMSLDQIITAQAMSINNYRQKLASVPQSKRHEIKQEDFVQVLAAATVNNYTWTWNEFFEWASRKEFVSRNHAEGLQLKRDKSRSFRRAFTLEELRAVFESNYYKRAEYDDASKYWVPFLLLYSGARLNEICQLVTDDIVVIGEIPCIKIFDDEADRQRLKNAESRRLVPIHKNIIEAGFLGYVESMRAAGERKLFPFLDNGREKHSKYLGNWNGRFLKMLGIKHGKGLDAHSYRHTVIKSFMNANVDERWAAAICGQGFNAKDDDNEIVKKAVTYTVYGRLPDPSNLKPIIDGLDFSLQHPPFVMPKAKARAKPRRSPTSEK